MPPCPLAPPRLGEPDRVSRRWTKRLWKVRGASPTDRDTRGGPRWRKEGAWRGVWWWWWGGGESGRAGDDNGDQGPRSTGQGHPTPSRLPPHTPPHTKVNIIPPPCHRGKGLGVVGDKAQLEPRSQLQSPGHHVGTPHTDHRSQLCQGQEKRTPTSSEPEGPALRNSAQGPTRWFTPRTTKSKGESAALLSPFPRSWDRMDSGDATSRGVGDELPLSDRVSDRGWSPRALPPLPLL